MNFEVIDNFFQVILLLIMALLSLVASVRQRDRRPLVLAFAYVCFAMGTLYYVLYLVIIGKVPQIFYVAEISWLASYLFFLSLQILRSEKLRIRFSVPALLCAVLVAAGVMAFRIFGPSLVMSGLLAVTVGVNAYLSVFRIQEKMQNRAVDVGMLVCIILQIALYAVSELMTDYTHFNIYFAVDITLSGCLAAMLPLTLREVKEK